jgi:hypothetical protein
VKRKKKHGASQALLYDMRRVLVADRWEGWARSHHHHIHLRLANLEVTGVHRASFERLFAQERALDGLLLDNPLRARLVSMNLERAVELELLNPLRTDVRFRIADGEWKDPDPASFPRVRAVIDLPPGASRTGGEVRVEAQIQPPGKKPRILARALEIPRQDPWLAVHVDASRIRAALEKRSGKWIARLEVPPAYHVYLTGVSYQLHREGAEGIQSLQPSGADRAVEFNPDKVLLVEARVTFSGRITRRIPVYSAGR